MADIHVAIIDLGDAKGYISFVDGRVYIEPKGGLTLEEQIEEYISLVDPYLREVKKGIESQDLSSFFPEVLHVMMGAYCGLHSSVKSKDEDLDDFWNRQFLERPLEESMYDFMKFATARFMAVHAYREIRKRLLKEETGIRLLRLMNRLPWKVSMKEQEEAINWLTTQAKIRIAELSEEDKEDCINSALESLLRKYQRKGIGDLWLIVMRNEARGIPQEIAWRALDAKKAWHKKFNERKVSDMYLNDEPRKEEEVKPMRYFGPIVSEFSKRQAKRMTPENIIKEAAREAMAEMKAYIKNKGIRKGQELLDYMNYQIQGYTQKEIAKKMGKSESTIKRKAADLSEILEEIKRTL